MNHVSGPAAKQGSHCDAAGGSRSEAGIGLFEVIAGTLVATLAVVGLAYSFGIGRALIDRYLVAREAMSRAEMTLDSLVTVPTKNIVGASEPFWSGGVNVGTTSWTTETVDDPVDGTAASSPSDPSPNDLTRLTVRVSWRVGGMDDDLRLTRLLNAP